MDWFGIGGDDEGKCVFCKDEKHIFDDPWTRVYLTTNCRHRVCKPCEEIHGKSGRPMCPRCGHRIISFHTELPEYMALRTLNEIRLNVYREWNLFEHDFKNKTEYAGFTEEREDLIELLMRSDRTISSEIREKQYAFRQKHRDTIVRNASRITEDRDVTLQWIENEKRQMEILKRQIQEEKTSTWHETTERKRVENDSRLGLNRPKRLQISESRDKEEETRTYMFNLNDPYLRNGPPPTVISTGSPPIVSDKALIGGLSELVIRRRQLMDLKMGWDLII